MNTKQLLLVLIFVVFAVGLMVLGAKLFAPQEAPNTENEGSYLATVTPSVRVTTVIPTEEPTVTFEVTPTPTKTPTPTASVVTPTPTVPSSFGGIHSNWIYGVTQQKINSTWYFINPDDKKQIVSAPALDSTDKTVVYKSDSNGEIGSFYKTSTWLYVVQKRDSSNSEMKFLRYSTAGKRVTLFKYISSKFDLVSFTIPKDTTTNFYIGFVGVSAKYQPMVMHVKNYSTEKTYTVSPSNKSDYISAMGMRADSKAIRVELTETDASKNIVDVSLE